MKWLRLLLRVLLWTVVLLAVPTLVLFRLLASDSGSRWLVMEWLSGQRDYSAVVESGNLLHGMRLGKVHIHGQRFDLDIGHASWRWRLVPMLSGRLQVDDLLLDQPALRLTGPAHPGPVILPTLRLPLYLYITRADLLHPLLDVRGLPLRLDDLRLDNSHWFLTHVGLGQVLMRHSTLGSLRIGGQIALAGDYPLALKGQLDASLLQRQGLGSLQVSAGQNLGNLHLLLDGDGNRLPARADVTLQTLTPRLPYTGELHWERFQSPWVPEQLLRSGGGYLRASGTLDHVQSTGSTNAFGKNLPYGQYDWDVRSDWHGLDIASLRFQGLRGSARVAGQVAWPAGETRWRLRSSWRGVELGGKWPALRLAVPQLTGDINSAGWLAAGKSRIDVDARLAGGEQWQVHDEAAGQPWQPGVVQQLGLHWAHLRRQVPGLGDTHSDQGSLELRGSLQAYVAEAELQLDSPRTPWGSWRIEGGGGNRQLRLREVTYAGHAGKALFRGDVELGSGIGWRGHLQFEDLHTGWLLPDWVGTFSGGMDTHGQSGLGVHELAIDGAQVSGVLRGKPLQVSGGIHASLPVGDIGLPHVVAHALQIHWGDDGALIQGGLEQQWALRIDARLNDLALIDPRLGGQLDVQLTVNGALADPDLETHATLQQLALSGISISQAELTGRVVKWAEQPSTASAKLTGITVDGHVIDALNVQADGTAQAHRLRWQVHADPYSSEAEIDGQRDPAGWAGRMISGQVTLPGMGWSLAGPALLTFVSAETTLHVLPHCWHAGAAQLCNDDEMVVGRNGHARAHLSSLDAARLQPWLPAALAIKADVSGGIAADWQQGLPPRLLLDLDSHNGVLALARDGGLPPLSYPFQLLSAGIIMQPDVWQVRGDLQSGSLGNGVLQLQLDPRTAARALTGNVQLQGLQLQVLQPFLPALTDLQGRVAVLGNVGGVLAKPEFHGKVTLDQGKLALRDAPVSLHDIGIALSVDGDQLTIGGQLSSGNGVATMSGDAGWGSTPHLNLHLLGQGLEVRQLPQVEAKLDPDLQVTVQPAAAASSNSGEPEPGLVTITGKVRVPSANLVIKALPEKAVPLSPDVVVVSEDQHRGRVQLVTVMQSWRIRAAVELSLGDDVVFHGFGVNGHLGGSLRLAQEGERGLQGTGEVELQKNARYDAYGQKLNITRGRLVFAGPLTQPGVDLEASKVVDSKTVGIRVSGRANAPQVAFFADEDMSQADIVSYLVLGRPLYQNGQLNVFCNNGGSSSGTGVKPVTSSSGAVTSGTSACAQGAASSSDMALAAALIKLGSSSGGEDVASRIGGMLGIRDVNVGAETTSADTQFTVSGYINPKLYLSYGVGVFTPVNTVKLRYNITPRLYLEAVSSLENAIDIYYNFKF